MKNENKGDIMLSAICVDNQQDEESIMISSHDEKLRWWKLENIGIDTFQKPSDVMDVASDEAALGILRFIEGWYLVPVKIVGPATKEALKKVYGEGILDIGDSCFEEFYERYAPIADYEPDIIVKPLVDIETFEGKVECDLVPARYLFPMGMMDGFKDAIDKCH